MNEANSKPYDRKSLKAIFRIKDVKNFKLRENAFYNAPNQTLTSEANSHFLSRKAKEMYSVRNKYTIAINSI